MNSKFQVGDLVIAPFHFKGIGRIWQIKENSEMPVVVETKSGRIYFTASGMYSNISAYPALYHAGTEITVKEAVPVRDLAWPWVNVYTDEHGKLYSGESHPTREEAIMNISKSWSYLCTTQLTPPKKDAAE